MLSENRSLAVTLADLRAGLNAAVIGIPQEINYGLLAFVPFGPQFAVIGVLAAIAASAAGSLLYTLLGAKLAQLVGPRPTLVVLVAGLLGALLAAGLPVRQLPPALCLTLAMSGLFLLLAARLGLGHFFTYLPLPVLGGFTNGVAVTLILSAVPLAVGLGLGHVTLGLNDLKPASLVVTALTVVLCLKPLRLGFVRQVPAVLQALVLATCVDQALRLSIPGMEGPLVGDLLRDFPALGAFVGQLEFPDLDLPRVLLLGKFALAVAAAAALETLAVTAHVEAGSARRSAGDAVLKRLGLVYLALAPLMMPVAGSLGRSVSLSIGGAKTNASHGAYAFFILAMSLLGYGLICTIPLAAIAGVLIVVARNMIGDSVAQALLQWRTATSPRERIRNLADFLVMAGVALITVFDSFITGLIVGTVAAMALFIRDQGRAVVRSIRYGDTTRSLRVRSKHARELQARHGREIIVVEAEGALFFGSMERLLSQLDELAPRARSLILDLRRVGDIDQTASELLRRAARRYTEQGCRVLLSHLPSDRALCRRLLACGLDREIPREAWTVDLDAALESAEGELLRRHGLTDGALHVVPLVESDLTSGLNLGQIHDLAAYLTLRRYLTGEPIFRQGDSSDSLYVIVRGAVGIHFSASGTEKKRLIAFGPGALFGEMALVTGAARSADAIADEDAELLELDAVAFGRLQSERPEIVVAILRRISVLVSERLRNTTELLRQELSSS